jgi:nicotinate phosphoribosyltransferase
MSISKLYEHSLSLLTDLYQLTMAYGYWKTGLSDQEAVFHLFYRKNPFKGGYAVACGLGTVVEYLSQYGFSDDDLAYLATLGGNDGKPLFEEGFLDYLRDTPFSCDIDAVPEGTVVFPHEPLIRIRGPLIQGQLIETPLLNMMNFQTLIATKSARICQAAEGDPVLEFGLRRAQGIDGALAASRSAFVGGCDATSNVLAGKLYDIPVKGTHAHSWVMCFDDEMESFKAYAKAMPNNCVFLVDTYDTVEGVRKAVEVGKWLRQQGHEMVGVRLDSGDLAYLSIESRKILDEGGFPDAVVVASNDLSETVITSLKSQGATIGMWGVGTKLATAYDQPALGGVYKLSAIRGPKEEWKYKVKLSEQAIKVSNPGVLQIRRYKKGSEFVADAIYDTETPLPATMKLVDPMDFTRQRVVDTENEYEDLLVPIYREGKQVYTNPSLQQIRARREAQLAAFHQGVRRFVNPHQYPVGLERGLHEFKMKLIMQARGVEQED